MWQNSLFTDLVRLAFSIVENYSSVFGSYIQNLIVWKLVFYQTLEKVIETKKKISNTY